MRIKKQINLGTLFYLSPNSEDRLLNEVWLDASSGILSERINLIKYMSFHFWLSALLTLFTKLNARMKSSAKLEMA